MRKALLPGVGLLSAGAAVGAGFLAAQARESLFALGAKPRPGVVYRNLPEPTQHPSLLPAVGAGGKLPPSELAKVLVKQLRGARSNMVIPLAHPLAPVEPGELAVTWFGHATTLIEVDGKRLITDPVWSNRCSPTQLFGPARLHPPPAPLEHLPSLDVILLSHDHYDHLDAQTIRSLAELTAAPFLVPTGVGAHLRHWGVSAERIIERGWWEEAELDGLTFTCTPARHFSGRGTTRNTTLWASWSIKGPRHKVYFGGDSGHTCSFAEIGKRLGLHDLTVLPIGAYHDLWREIHMNPEEAASAHRALAKPDAPMLPIHWGTFQLAPHPWAEPIQRLIHEQGRDPGLRVLSPMPGQRLDAHRPPAQQAHWWEQVA